MSRPQLRLQKPLEDFIDLLEKLSGRTLPLLSECFSSEIVYSSPAGSFHGTDDIEVQLKQNFSEHERYQYRVHDFAWSHRGGVAYISWTLQIKGKRKFMKIPLETEVNGMSELSFNDEGLIMSWTECHGFSRTL